MKTDNELIAEFMGDRDKVLCDPKWMKGDELVYLRYHLSWDWLMPVVARIREVKPKNDFFIELTVFHATIDRVYARVVEFIIWYNTQNQTN